MPFTESQLAFVAKTLHEWGESLEKKLTDQLRANDIGVTDELLRSLSFDVLQTTNPEFKLTFKEYGRLRDMGVGRGRKVESATTNREILTGGRTKKSKKIKKARWYSKTAYGYLNSLQSQLSYGYMDAAVNTIVKNLKAA